jgi:diguanylate cyclase (GGDEF)-like protein/PAS domain S-box-containing protein
MNKQPREFERFIDSIGDACLVIERPRLNIVAANAAASALFRAESQELVGSTVSMWCDDISSDAFAEQILSVNSSPEAMRVVHRRANGATFAADVTVATIESDANDEVSLVIREHSCPSATLDSELKDMLLENSLDGMVAHTLEGRLLYANQAAVFTWGMSYEEAQAAGPYGWTPHSTRAEIVPRTEQLLETGEARFRSNRVVDGQPVSVEIHARVVQSAEGPIVISTTRDVTESTRTEEMIRYLAYHDTLTGLANRVLLQQELQRELTLSERHGDTLGVVFVDLNRFKPVNDTYGHTVGDHVLREIADRLAASVRETDVVARLGGDEFVIVLPRLSQRSDIEVVGTKVQDAVSRPILAGGHEIHLTCSVGLAIHEKGETVDELLTRADLAMYGTRDLAIEGEPER